MGVERALVDVLECLSVDLRRKSGGQLCTVNRYCCYLPREFECAVHRVGKVLPERGEQQRAVIAHPKVARALDKVNDALLARLECVRGV